MSSGEKPSNGSYLSKGRQITVSDLLKNGLLEKGEEIFFKGSSASGEEIEHVASVTGDEQIMLSDGRKFNSPTAAAQALTGDHNVDGWSLWARGENGRILDDLRQSLLDRSADSSRKEETGNGYLDLALERHARLKQARQRADEHTPESVAVKELIGLWGAARRSRELMQLIEVDLDNHGLTTRPDLMEVGPDDDVKLVNTVQGPDRLSPTVGALPSARAGVETVKENADIQKALTIMTLKDYSRLPVVGKNKNGGLRGVVTWKSLARAINADRDCSLADATEPCDPVEAHRDLLEVIPDVQAKGFVIVNGEDGGISGIVTTTDVAQRYSDAAIPFLLIGVIDTLLRRTVAENIPMHLINELCADPERGHPELESANELSMGDYARVLANPRAWERLGWPIDRPAFIDQLGLITKVRNDVMHFNPDPMPEGYVLQLKSMISLVRTHSGL